MQEIINSYCKFNLILKILDYSECYKKHKLFSIFVLSKKFFDQINVYKIKNKNIEIIYQDSDNKKIKIENSIINKAIFLFEKFYNLKVTNFKFVVIKNIPIGSGLGGGSSNAACILNFLYKKYNIPKNKQIPFLKIAIELGSDIPFFLSNYSSALVTNFGDSIYPINLPNIDHSIIINKLICKTDLVFQKYKDLEKFNNFGYQNDLMPAAFLLYPDLVRIYKNLLKKHNNVIMSGSGSSFVVLHNNKRSKYE